MKADERNYQARMQRVLEYIEQHLDGDLGLSMLSSVAAFSKFHFHRQFTATFDMSVHRYVQLSRMKRAAHDLVHTPNQSVTTIALASGYDAPDAFARAFRHRFGQSPMEFRKSPNWEPWAAALEPFTHARSKLMRQTFSPDDVIIREVAAIPVAVMEHRGNPARVPLTVQRFIAWRKAVGLTPDVSPTFNIFHSDPSTVPPDEYRLDLCVGTDAPIQSAGEEIQAGLIPAGRCAVLQITGVTDFLEPAARYLYRDWLPMSGAEARDFPLYCQRFFPEGPHGQTVTELFLPLS